MASYTSTAEEVEKAAPPPEVRAPVERPQPSRSYALADVVLRFLLFASCLVAVLLMVTSKETKVVAVVPFPPFQITRTAKFNHSPAFIYFVAALSLTGLYSLITTLLSFFSLLKPGSNSKLVSHLVLFDVVYLGIVASATGAGASVAYIGLKGNSHVQWQKICNVYGDFCRHIGASLALSLFGSTLLVWLILFSVSSLSKRIPK